MTHKHLTEMGRLPFFFFLNQSLVRPELGYFESNLLSYTRVIYVINDVDISPFKC